MRNSHILGFKECVALPQVLHSFAVNLEFDCAGRNIADYRARMTVRSACLARRELDSLDFDMLNQFGGAKHGREQSFPLVAASDADGPRTRTQAAPTR